MPQAERNCQWYFAPRAGGVDQAPNDSMGDTFKKLPYQALVREAIQNSLDAAKNDEEPVIVTFKLSSVNTGSYPNLFGVREHIKACLELYTNEDSQRRFNPMLEYIDDALNKDKIFYLEVSDKNTKGMVYTAGSTCSPFFAFVKSIGNSVKDNKAKGGSKGYGKAAYFNVSKIRTMLISSLTEDGQYVFEGVSALCTHEIDGIRREHYGFYTNNEKEIPITNEDDIPVRFCRKEVGTSAFIMGVDYSDKGVKNMRELIIESVITNFWAAILENKLEVNILIAGDDSINCGNIFKWAEQCFNSPDDVKSYFKNPRPYMDAFCNTGNDINHMKFEEEKPTLGKVELYLTRTKSGTDTFICMRSPLMMVKAQPKRTNYGFYGVFICRDERGNEVLRSMEEGSHTEWDYKNCDDKEDREKAKQAEAEIKQFLDECIAKVFYNGNSTTLTFGGLDEFLSIPTSFDDDEDVFGDTESDNGNANGERTDKENPEPTSDIIDDDNNSKADTEKIKGQIVIYDGNNGRNGGVGSGSSSTGGGKGDNSGSNENGGSSGSNGNGSRKGRNGKSGKGFGDGDSNPSTKLQVHYRTFAQACGGGGYLHRLIINSNRTSENATICVMCAGDSTNEKIAIKKAKQGDRQESCSGNIISNVQLQEGRNVIDIWFTDDMRHSITLTVNEN